MTLEADEQLVAMVIRDRATFLQVGALDSLPAQQRLLRLGGCGEPVQELFRAVGFIPPPRASDPWIAMVLGPTDGVMATLVDADGIADPVPLAAGLRHEAWGTIGPIFSRHASIGEVSPVVEISVDPAEAVAESVRHPGLRDIAAGPRPQPTRWLSGIDDASHLVALDIHSGGHEVLRDGVHRGELLGPEGRFFVAADAEERRTLVDRQTGRELTLGRAAWPESHTLDSGRIVRTTAGPFDDRESSPESHVVLLPEMRELWWEGPWPFWDFGVRAPDGSWMFGSADGFYRLPPNDEAMLKVLDAEGIPFVSGEHFYLFAMDPDREAWEGVGSVYRIDADGSDLVDLFGRIVGVPIPLADHKWAYLDALDERERGTLHVLDEETGEDIEIASNAGGVVANVMGSLPWLNREDRRTFIFDVAEPAGGPAQVLRLHLDRLEW